MASVRVVNGENRGKQHDLFSGFRIGRLSECDMALSDSRVSRRHAEFVHDGGQWRIRDSDTENGTFVDGQEVHETALSDGAQIQVAETIMIFSLGQDEKPAEAGGADDDGSADDVASTVRAVASPENESSVAKAVAGTDPAKVLRAIDTIYDISRSIHATHGIDVLFDTMAGKLLEVFPCSDCCHILLWDANDESFVPKAAKARGPDGKELVSFSRSLAKRVATSKEALLCVNTEKDAVYGESPSVQGLAIRSCLCAPIVSAGIARGVIYLDSRRHAEAFDETDLRTLCVIANDAALGLANVEMLQRLEAESRLLRTERTELEAELERERGPREIVGASPAIQASVREIEKYAPIASIPVLLTGETGTGKELFARAVHKTSPRRDKPFRIINCPALPKDLVESELFGHEKGAFTGATAQKIGKLEDADGGTVFLDEIGDLSLDAQAKLLRFLQEGEFERVGGNELIHVEVRIVAATNHELTARIEAGEFREDLYYRLEGAQIHLPPLRERRSDIVTLANHFLSAFAEANGLQVRGFSPDALGALHSYDWPGTVRELHNAIRAAAVGARGKGVVDREDLPAKFSSASRQATPRTGTLHEAVEALKREMIIDKLYETQGNIRRSAEDLGLAQQGLRNIIERSGLQEVLEQARKSE